MIKQYFESKGWQWFSEEGQLNIVYFEGANADFSVNDDAMNRWNDRRTVWSNDEVLLLNVEATTEPGLAATIDKEAAKIGGVFRIQLGQHLSKWRLGYHKIPSHPALKQDRDIYGYRDANRDGYRTGDRLALGYGINQHTTSTNYRGSDVNYWSAGCLVGKYWNEHKKFIELIKSDDRFRRDREFLFSTTIIDTGDFDRFRNRSLV